MRMRASTTCSRETEEHCHKSKELGCSGLCVFRTSATEVPSIVVLCSSEVNSEKCLGVQLSMPMHDDPSEAVVGRQNERRHL